jgi:spore coat polysaccharide biosynthesis protein SpsF
VGIIQARMGSSRLPGKVMMDLCGFPVLQWVIERCRMSSKLNEIVVATTNKSDDDFLVELVKTLGVEVYRGNENDVLGRYLEASEVFNVDLVVRICADNPLVAPEEIDRLVDFYLMVRPDYAFNHIPKMGNNYPDGLGAEILSYEVLKQISNVATLARHREHVTGYIWDNVNKYDIKTLPCPSEYDEINMKLDIDVMKDIIKMREICKGLNFSSSPVEIRKEWSAVRG